MDMDHARLVALEAAFEAVARALTPEQREAVADDLARQAAAMTAEPRPGEPDGIAEALSILSASINAI